MDSIVAISSMQYGAVQENSDPQRISQHSILIPACSAFTVKDYLAGVPLLSDHPPILPKLRGNARRFVLDCDADRAVYLKLLRENMELYGVALIGYCLMSNHVHMIAILTKPEGLAEALKQIHGRYACYWNVAHPSSGHVGQGRYYSCPLDQTHLWEALRYTELNPVRARLVSELFANELTQAGHLGTRSLFRS